MTHSLNTLWITIISIFAMLMSSYASSMPVNMMGMPMSVASPCSHAATMNASSMVSAQVTCTMSMADHQVSEHAMPDSSSQHASGSHCAHSSDGSSSCCVTVCLSAYFPIQQVSSPSGVSYTLAPYHSLDIGLPVVRVQSLLRPPSA